MTLSLHGIPVSRGIAIGRALVWDSAMRKIPRVTLSEASVEAEQNRFMGAVRDVLSEFDTLRADLPADAPPEFDALLHVHSLILQDPALAEKPKALIAEKKINAEWALVQQLDKLQSQFENIEDEYIRDRNIDVRQVVERIMKNLQGNFCPLPDAVDANGEAWLIVAHDISPADMMQLKGRPVAAFVTDVGGTTSHTAIVARSLNIPAVVGVPQGSQMICGGEMLVVDGKAGVIYVEPDDLVIDEYRRKQGALYLSRQRLKRLRDTPAMTACGERVYLMGNIELPDDTAKVNECGADGIGLFRSEFLFMNRPDWPSEDEQYEAYRSVIRSMKGKPVTVRTLDLGADKTLQTDASHAAPPDSTNTPLGLRSIRFCLAEPNIFLTQLRAILRASEEGPVQILLPMLSNLREIEASLTHIELAREQLEQRGIHLKTKVPVGGMIEVPAAALCLPMFTSKLDFLSIGTNDLIQYVLAIDRVDAQVAHMYDPLHPAVLRLIHDTIVAGQQAGISVSVCGEMAGDVRLTRLLLGMGLRNFSMHPAQLLDVKEELLKTSLEPVVALTQQIMKVYEPARIAAAMQQLADL
ncbi:MAG: phosphoenolpyruvate--protein phosphotransferase [Burkholderiaceae bacterium]